MIHVGTGTDVSGADSGTGRIRLLATHMYYISLFDIAGGGHSHHQHFQLRQMLR